MAQNPGVPYEQILTQWCRKQKHSFQKASQVAQLATLAQSFHLKLPDFVILDSCGKCKVLVDAKGRSNFCENYLPRDQLADFVKWSTHYPTALVWVYSDHHTAQAPPFERLSFRGYKYVIAATEICEYQRNAKDRSEKWRTVTVSRKCFRDIIRPLGHFISAA